MMIQVWFWLAGKNDESLFCGEIGYLPCVGETVAFVEEPGVMPKQYRVRSVSHRFRTAADNRTTVHYADIYVEAL